MPSLKQFRVFASIARHGNLGEAAAELCLSKGAVSQALGELERRLGTPVFDRVHPRLRLNAQGEQLQPLVEDVLDRAEGIRHLFANGGDVGGVLRLGASQTIGNYLLPVLLAQVPAVQAKVQISNTHDLCAMLGRFELDLALIEGKNHHPDLITQPWREDEMLIVCSPQHALAGTASVTLADLQGCDWVQREANSGSREQFDQELVPLIAPLGKTRELNGVEALLLAVEHNLGLTFVSRLAAQDRLDRGKLFHIDVGLSFARQLSLVWHRQKFHGALLRNFIEAMHAA